MVVIDFQLLSPAADFASAIARTKFAGLVNRNLVAGSRAFMGNARLASRSPSTRSRPVGTKVQQGFPLPTAVAPEQTGLPIRNPFVERDAGFPSGAFGCTYLRSHTLTFSRATAITSIHSMRWPFKLLCRSDHLNITRCKLFSGGGMGCYLPLVIRTSVLMLLP